MCLFNFPFTQLLPDTEFKNAVLRSISEVGQQKGNTKNQVLKKKDKIFFN